MRRRVESAVENNVEQIEWDLDNKVLDTVTIVVRADRIARVGDSQAFAVVSLISLVDGVNESVMKLQISFLVSSFESMAM